jgi:cytidyltransferase-like protein
MRLVMCNGVFDVLHVGHLRHLQAARTMGDVLIVALTEDHAVNKGPGLPLNTWADRAEMLHGLSCVSKVYPSISCVWAIRAFRPNVFVKGIDYKDSPLMDATRKACEDVGASLRFTDTPKMSSGEIIRRLKATNL